MPVDAANKLFRKKNDELKPDQGDIYVGSGDFIAQGHDQVKLLVKHAGLKPTYRVLDVGSGIGRTAVPLTSLLDKEGSYEGFDVVEKGVRWCEENISSKYPNFSFLYVPLSNDLYNSFQKSSLTFEYPYSGNEFDLVFLFSVFSHMQLDEIGHYLNEISRVLKEGGCCLMTCFTYTNENEGLVATQNGFNFPHKLKGYRLMNDKVKSANVAIQHDDFVETIEASGLKVKEFVPGYWLRNRKKTEANSFQDIFVVELKM